MTKTNKVLRMLANGSTVSHLTVLPLRIGNLNDIIMRLRNRGYGIRTTSALDEDGQRYTKYVMSAESRAGIDESFRVAA